MPDAWYRARIAHWSATRARRRTARGTVVSRLRLVSFLGGGRAPLVGCLSRRRSGRAAIAAGAAALVVFAILVVRHARILDEVERADAALDLNGQGLARLGARLERAAGGGGARRSRSRRHPYARDLDLFGHASLAKWLGRPATIEGAHRLSNWLLTPAPAESFTDAPGCGRRNSSREARVARNARHRGRSDRRHAAELVRFLAWAEGSDLAVPRADAGCRVRTADRHRRSSRACSSAAAPTPPGG